MLIFMLYMIDLLDKCVNSLLYPVYSYEHGNHINVKKKWGYEQ